MILSEATNDIFCCSFSAVTSIALIFLALDIFNAIQRVFDHGGYEEIHSEFPYSLVLSGGGVLASLVACLVMAVVCCKIHQSITNADLMEKHLIEEEKKKQEEIRKHHLPDRKTRNGAAAQPIEIKEKEQVVYSIHL